jgi:hypothetical protein
MTAGRVMVPCKPLLTTNTLRVPLGFIFLRRVTRELVSPARQGVKTS